MNPGSEVFVTSIAVRFADCDPAGIVFYPRYFEMFNAVVEDWCESGLGMSFRELITERGRGLPTVHLETDFVAPAHLGDRLQAHLQVNRLGTSSITIGVRLAGPAGDDRVRSRQTLVLVERSTNKAIAIPELLRARIERYFVSQA